MIGYDRELSVFNLGDTAKVQAFLYDQEDAPARADDLLSVTFKIQKPDKTIDTISGTVEDDGSGTMLYTDTDQVGQYTTIAAFETVDGTQSSRADFEVVDPFEIPDYSQSYVVAAWAWKKFEDCFDAEDEGPWLRDATLNTFNKDKMEQFIDAALFDINVQNPATNETIDRFVQPEMGSEPMKVTSDLPLLAQGVALQVIRHLMRSYVEQPNPVGAPIAWHDRRDYLQRWQLVYGIEMEEYKRMLALWKRQFLGLGHSKLIISAKAGRLLPAPLRTRYAGRGWW